MQNSKQLQTRWIIVEENVKRPTGKSRRIKTNISGHFLDKSTALFSLDGLFVEEKRQFKKVKKEAPFLKFKVCEEPGFMFRKEDKEHYYYLASLH